MPKAGYLHKGFERASVVAFSFEPLLAFSAGHLMAVSTGPKHQLNTPGRMVQADRAGGACVPLKWCTAAAAMVH